MYIDRIEVENFRGIRDWSEEFGDNNVRILGPNGSGKSSVIQAIEFVLTGDVDMLRGSGTMKISFNEYASHVKSDPTEAEVDATFKQPGEEDITLRRTVSNPENVVVLEPSGQSEIPDWLRRQMDAAKLGHSILDRDRLLQFISAPEGERGDKIDRLFRLEEVDDRRVAVKGAVRDHESIVEERKSSKEAADQRFFDLFPSGVSTRSGAVEIINERREKHEAEPIDTLGDDVTDGISFDEDTELDPLQSDATVSLLKQRLSKIPDRQTEFCKLLSDLRTRAEELREEDDVERELNTLDLLDSGLSLVDSYDEKCPLCLKSWDESALIDRLEERKDRAEHLREVKRDLNDQYDAIGNLLVKYTDNLQRLRTELAEDYPDAVELIEDTRREVQAWRDELNEGALTEIPEESNTAEVLFPASLVDELEQLAERAEELPEPSDATESVALLARVDDRYQELAEKETELEEEKALQEVLESVEERFLEARNRVLSEAFDEIRKNFEYYYQRIHQDEEADDFSAILEPTETGVKFKPEFYDQGHHQPGAVHSEGHRDSMGLALFLAMSDVGGEDIDILLLDDVMMSIDSGHRSNVATLLAEEVADDYQILLTTHDKTWDRHLKLTQEFEKQVRFSKCSLGAGPLQVGSIGDPWSRIDYHLEEDDVTAAAAWIRKTVEWYSRRACKELEADVPYHKIEDQDFSIGMLFQRAIGEYESLLETKDVVSESEYGQALFEVEDLEAELDAVEEVKQGKERHLNLLNTNIHYNEPEAAFYTGEELKQERDAFRKAYELLFCEDCQSWVQNGDYVYCNCTIRVG